MSDLGVCGRFVQNHHKIKPQRPNPKPSVFADQPMQILIPNLGYDGRLTPLFEGLDVLDFPISTESELAQTYFNQGLILTYGFNHAEASRSYREGIAQDPECAMCYWGIAYVLGPNYNAGMDPEVLPAANEAVAKARMYSYKTSEKEQALIAAITMRYPQSTEEDMGPFNESYAEAMEAVYRRWPDDPDIGVMTAEALMNLHPWDLWLKSGEPQPWTPRIMEILEGILESHPDHPQAMHLYIHAIEASPFPEKAIPVADNLRDAVPGSGHLLHMPSHLDINTGHYHKGRLANEWAVKVDSAYIETCKASGVYPLGYYPHNWHFLAACAALEGNGTRALEASRFLARFVEEQNVMREPELATLQHFYSIPWYIMVKFARWEEILSEEVPDADLKYPTAILLYAKGMAYANKGLFAEAEASLEKVREIKADPDIADLTIWEINSMVDLLEIADLVLSAEIAKHQGRLEESIALFTKAVEKEDQLNYNEPPDWFFSVRHHLGDVLIQAGNFAEAEAVYLKDLEEYKENGWALKGLYLSQIYQDDIGEAAKTNFRFELAWEHATVELEASVL